LLVSAANWEPSLSIKSCVVQYPQRSVDLWHQL
jgi:hypothetical protein